MKRTFVLLAAALALFVVSSIQAAEIQVEIYSQTNGQRPVVARNAHVALVDANGQKAAESSNNWKVKTDVAPGDYLLVVEDPATNYSGSTGIVVEENNDPKLFMMTTNGVNPILDKHSCLENHPDDEKYYKHTADCKHDANCICRVVCCDEDYAAANAPAQYPTSNTIPSAQLPTSTPAVPQAPAAGLMGGQMGGYGWALMGAIAGIIVIAAVDDDEPKPITREIFYR